MDNKFTARQLRFFIVGPRPPIFLSSPLMFPWILGTVLRLEDPHEASQMMTSGTLRGYDMFQVMHTHDTTMLPSKDKSKIIDGMLVCGLNQAQLECVQEYIGMDHHKEEIDEVEIFTAEGDSRVIVASVFIWTGAPTLLIPWKCP